MTKFSKKRLFLARTALVSAFVLASAAVVFNVNLISYVKTLIPSIAADAAPVHSSVAFKAYFDGILLIVLFVVLLLISLIRGTPRLTPPKQ